MRRVDACVSLDSAAISIFLTRGSLGDALGLCCGDAGRGFMRRSDVGLLSSSLSLDLILPSSHPLSIPDARSRSFLLTMRDALGCAGSSAAGVETCQT
eukprot:3415461-Rhodomonas_salina.3